MNIQLVASSVGGFAAGLACANYAAIILWIINSKWITATIRKYPAQAKAIAAELNKDIDAVADAPK